jgi:hypothetical protein
VPPNATIQITFNANIDPSSVLVNATSMSSIVLEFADSTGQTVEMPGAHAAVSGNVLTISASGGFYGGSTYTLDVYTSLADVNHRALQTPVEVKFTTTGSQPKSEIIFQITYEFGASGSTGVSHFTLSQGTASHSYTQNDIPLMIDQSPSAWVGTQVLTSTYHGTFLAGSTYYFAVKACTPTECSGYSPEAPVPIP